MTTGTGEFFGAFTEQHAVELIMQVFTGSDEPTPAAVEDKVDAFLAAPVFAHLASARSTIVHEILMRTSVVIGTASTLDQNDNHVEWLGNADRSSWGTWPRLDDYLRRIDRLPPAVLVEVNTSTDQVLGRLENPERPGTWDRRGLVVGHVQSGKTTHYTALAAKALDAGYQIVIIMAGVHNSLRSQTHERIDRHLIGRNSAALIDAVRERRAPERTEGLIGVGAVDQQMGRSELPFTILTCTTSADDGDFRTTIAKAVGFQVGHPSRLVLVVKKNSSILRNLIDWLRVQHAIPTTAGRPIPNPALVIDDEADHASINTARDPESDPSRINALIRELLMSFSRVGFVGYTATPFANIFTHYGDPGGELGPDLFPQSFIVSLKAPSDYIGPALVFGNPGDESAGIAARLPLPMHVPVTDSSSWLPDRHKRTWIPGALPSSAREAIRLFVMVCAARALRGDVDVHNSMLVHGTRFIDVQERISLQLQDEIDALRNIIGLADDTDVAALYEELQEIWKARIEETYPVFAARLGDRCKPLPLWEEVYSELPNVLERVQVMRINGSSTDALAYSRAKNGLTVIAIGGDKLSRGLTLEGLSISYFLRSSQMFDTLMQMGRWFGYRPGYADLCRVYTTDSLCNAFKEIALATDELRGDLDYMAAVGKTPEEFGLRVREPSDGLVITAANKIRTGENVTVRFAGTIVQTLEIARKGEQAERNLAAVRALLLSLPSPTHDVRGVQTPHSVWHRVDAQVVLTFLHQYEAFSTPSFYNHCEALSRYITQQVGRDELSEWTIAVIGKRIASDKWHVGDLRLPKVAREDKGDPERFVTGAVVGSAEEAIDLSADEWSSALALSGPTTKVGSERTIPQRERTREMRPATRGLLLIYPILSEQFKEQGAVDPIPAIALSFPTSQTARALSYKVNRTWIEQRGLFTEPDDDSSTA
jgi:hypothetical protein